MVRDAAFYRDTACGANALYREEAGTSLFASLCNTAIFRTREGEVIIRRLRQMRP